MIPAPDSVENESQDEIKDLVAKNLCEIDHLFFSRFFFKHRQNLKFLVNWHHQVISDAVQQVIDGKIEILVVNVPPGSSKTEIVVINLIARGLALNPWARFLHLSYSDDLALLNSATARDLVRSDEYQFFWPRQIATDAKSKQRWNVLVDGKVAGGVYATSLGGQVTGFRAGHMAEGFQGAIIIDDPLKPEDAFSKSKVEQANRKLLTTVKSRKANSKTPIILVMQRIAENDPSDFLLKGNLGKNVTHIKIPAIIDDKYVAEKIPKAFQPGVDSGETDKDGRFSYWPYKEPLKDLLALESGTGTDNTGSRVSRHVYAGQYGQNPTPIGGNLIKGEYFKRYRELPRIKYRVIYADTASKTKRQNDYSVFESWGLGDDGRIYLLDLIRGKWEAPELQKQAVAFWSKHTKIEDSLTVGSLRWLKVEDKSSGTGLIQTLKAPPYSIPIKEIPRNIDKLQRVNDGLPYIEAGLVCVPESAPFTLDFIAECEAFSADDSHAFDDQIDPMLDAIKDMLASGNKLKQWESLAG